MIRAGGVLAPADAVHVLTAAVFGLASIKDGSALLRADSLVPDRAVGSGATVGVPAVVSAVSPLVVIFFTSSDEILFDVAMITVWIIVGEVSTVFRCSVFSRNPFSVTEDSYPFASAGRL